ncbi:MAG: hypothetical protein M3Z25_14550 [Actinomycetota bacterium]|nr:hypothetical protein [Actinomycetota bacterium]
MDVTDALVAAVPEFNVRVAMDEFAPMWRFAERWHGVWMPNPRTVGTIGGIVDTCRWMAGVTDAAPATGRRVRATWETITDEVAYVEDTITQVEQGRTPTWTLRPPGRADGVILTFAWAWLGADLPVHYFDLPGTPAGTV